MRRTVFKKEEPKEYKGFEEVLQKAIREGYVYITSRHGYMFFYKDIIEKRIEKYKGGTEILDVLEELEKIVNFWNIKFKEKRTITADLKKAYCSLRQDYSREEMEHGFNEYLKAKKDSDKKYRLTPIKFLKQKINGITSYL